MSRRPKLVWVSIVLMGLFAFEGLLNPGIPGLAIAAISAAAIATLWKGRAWGGYGPALLTVAGMAITTSAVWSDLLPPQGGIFIIGQVFSAGVALVYFTTGRAVQKTYGTPGAAWPWIALSVATLAFIVFWPMAVPSESMEPTLLPGDSVLVSRLDAGHAVRGELVVNRMPQHRDSTMVRRVVGIPGDRIRMEDHLLKVNGRVIQEPYVRVNAAAANFSRANFPSPQMAPIATQQVENGEVVVPAGGYFVLGDNRDNSLDSRDFGCVSGEDILGRPVLIYHSADNSPNSLLRTRWRRLLRFL